MKIKLPLIKGRGAQINTANPYHRLVYDENPIDWEQYDEDDPVLKTQYIPTYPKTILSKVTSPDIPGDWSMNPYQGCEHGCIYCYARNTHPYWGYSAGLDFEQKILVKQNAAQLLEKRIKHPKWEASPIMFSGNTDCYQPVERKLEVTRSLLQVLWKYRHPVGMITKNSLILRDLDLLQQMAEHRLVHVAISLTTLDDDIRKVLEPRTASVNSRLKTIQTLVEHQIPTMVMMAPIIPGLNEHEIFELVRTVADLGVHSVGYTMVRLNGDVAQIFTDWVEKLMPDRADKILNKIRDCHGGTLNDSRFGTRMSGQGHISEIIAKQFRLARKKYLSGRQSPAYNLDLHREFKNPQLKLF